MKGLKNILNTITIPTDEQCEECGTTLLKVKFSDKETTLCPQCTKERKEQQDKELAEQWEQETYKAKAYKYFRGNSVINDLSILKANFKDLDTSEKDVKDAKDKAVSFINSTLEDESVHFILTGKSGTGKSHIAMATIRNLIEMSRYDKKVIFIHYATLLDEIKKGFDYPESKIKVDRLKSELKKCAVLVIDDLGVEIGSINNPTPPSRFNLELLNLILENRINKPLIVTTNLSESQIKEFYGERNFSRLFNRSQGFAKKMDKVTDKRLKR